MFGVQLDEFADHRIVGVALGVDHQHVARFKQGQGLVNVQIISGTSLDGQCGTHQLARHVVAGKAPSADVATQVVADVRGDYRSERFNEPGGGQSG
ncbi:hypothetical protein D3C75_1134310 [compost metagenome]